MKFDDETTWKLLDFEAWGNPTDGWDVNSASVVAVIPLPDYPKNYEIYDYLMEIGYLRFGVKMRQIKFNFWDENNIELSRSKDGMPICRLERVR